MKDMEQVVEIPKNTEQENQHKENAKEEPCNLHKFNIAAFAMPGLWGLFNRLPWVVVLNIVVSGYFVSGGSMQFLITISILFRLTLGIFLGIKGNKLSWNQYANDADASATKFEKRQRVWQIIGIVVLIYLIITMIAEFV